VSCHAQHKSERGERHEWNRNGVHHAAIALNAPDMLSTGTAERVRAAVKRTGYVPNMIAGGLASSRSRLVAAVIPAISQSIFSSTIQALTDSLAEVGYTVMLGLTGAGRLTRHSANEENRMFRSRHISISLVKRAHRRGRRCPDRERRSPPERA
jgi:DNA-binding LacI/PurR family transcriptional regulator